jgi:hypothetical protein
MWGKWTVKVVGHETATLEAQGGADAPPDPSVIDIPVPKIAPTFTAAQVESGLFLADLTFTENCPANLAGYVTYRYAIMKRQVDKEFPESINWKLDGQTGQFIENVKLGGKVTRSFALTDYTAGGTSRVAAGLCKAVEKFRQALRRPLEVKLTDATGLKAVVKPLAKVTLQEMQDAADKVNNPYQTTLEVKDGKPPTVGFTTEAPTDLQWKDAKSCSLVLARRVPEDPTKTPILPPSPTGLVRFELDPGEVFHKLLVEAAPQDDERVVVKAAFEAVNGLEIEAYEGPDVFAVLAKAGFTDWSIVLDSGRNSHQLVVRLGLKGNDRDWAAAKPVILVDGKEFKPRQVPGPNSASVLEAVVPLAAPQNQKQSDYRNKQFNVEAKVSNPDATFEDERIAVPPPDPLKVYTTPKVLGFLLSREDPKPRIIITDRSGKLTFSAMVHCCPLASLKLRCALKSAPGKPARAKADKHSIEDLFTAKQVIYADGDDSLDGEFYAELDKGKLESGETYVFSLGPADKDKKIFGVEVAALETQYP